MVRVTSSGRLLLGSTSWLKARKASSPALAAASRRRPSSLAAVSATGLAAGAVGAGGGWAAANGPEASRNAPSAAAGPMRYVISCPPGRATFAEPRFDKGLEELVARLRRRLGAGG